jgi:hypothetical protein
MDQHHDSNVIHASVILHMLLEEYFWGSFHCGCHEDVRTFSAQGSKLFERTKLKVRMVAGYTYHELLPNLFNY